MKNGKIEPQRDSETLMQIYKKFDIYGRQRELLTAKEQILIFALAEYLGNMEGKDGQA